jgi:hypothetical protein
LPVPALFELLALKVVSGQAAMMPTWSSLGDIGRIPDLRRMASKRLGTTEARERLKGLAQRARAELGRRRR